MYRIFIKSNVLLHHNMQIMFKKSNVLLHQNMYRIYFKFYATLAYIRRFISAGCYDNDPWYLVTNLAGHLDFAGFYFSKCPANSKPPANSSDEESPSLNIMDLPGLEHRLPLTGS